MPTLLYTFIPLIFLQIACTVGAVSLIPNLSPNNEHALISADLLDDFTRFTQFAFAAAVLSNCSSPLGTTLLKTIDNRVTDTQGYIVRDDAAKQIIVSFRGTEQILQDGLTDLQIELVPYVSSGVDRTNGARAHYGFLNAYNSVAHIVLDTVASELDRHPDYELISTGHSLGGSLASIASVSLKSNFPNTPLRVYTFGQPRTGDAAYADFVEDLVGVENIFRAVHTSDGVPTMVPLLLGYRHHGTEYWNFLDPSTHTENVIVCPEREDPSCSDSILSTGINLPHFEYFGLSAIDVVSDPSSVCW